MNLNIKDYYIFYRIKILWTKEISDKITFQALKCTKIPVEKATGLLAGLKMKSNRPKSHKVLTFFNTDTKYHNQSSF